MFGSLISLGVLILCMGLIFRFIGPRGLGVLIKPGLLLIAVGYVGSLGFTKLVCGATPSPARTTSVRANHCVTDPGEPLATIDDYESPDCSCRPYCWSHLSLAVCATPIAGFCAVVQDLIGGGGISGVVQTLGGFLGADCKQGAKVAYEQVNKCNDITGELWRRSGDPNNAAAGMAIAKVCGH